MDYRAIADFIDLVKNPTKYEKALAALIERDETIRATVAGIGELNKVKQLHDEAESLVEKAKEQALKIVEEANKVADARKELSSKALAESNERLAKIKEQEQRYKESAILTENTTNDLLRKEKELAKLERNLSDRLSSVTKREVEVSEKQEKLRKALS